MKKTKKLLSLLLSVLMLLSMCVIPGMMVSAETNSSLVWSGLAKDANRNITGVSVSDNKLVYTAANNTAPTYWDTAIAGYYIGVPAGTYRFEADISVSEALSSEGLFNFGFNSNNGKVLADNYIDYPDNSGRDEVKYSDIEAGEPYVCYFTTTTDNAWVEPYFFFSSPSGKYNVDLSIGEMRVYAVDSIPAIEEKEDAVWTSWAKNLAYQGSGVSVNGNKLVYTAANGTHNYWERNTYGGTTLAAGTYRLEADMTVAEALSNAEIFNFEIAGGNAANGYSDIDGRDFVRRGDIKDGAPYVFYFTVSSDAYVEFCFHFSGTGSKNNVDLSIGEMRVYAVDSVPEVEEKENAVWVNWAKDLAYQGTGVSVNGNKLVYTAANGTHNYWERNTYGGTTLAAGTYRLEADMTVAEALSNAEIFNFEIAGGNAADGYSDTDGRDFVRRGDIEDGAPYVFYFTVSSDAYVEFCFHFSGTGSKNNVDLSIGEMRVYAVDSVPEVEEKEYAIWANWAKNLPHQGTGVSVNGNELVYTAANGTHNYWERNTYSGTTLAAGTYRFEADMTIGEAAPFEEIFNFEIVGGKAVDGYSDTDGRDFVRRGDIEDGAPYVFYFTVAETSGVEFCFHFSGTGSKYNVDLSIGEIRVYAVDSVPETSFEVPIKCGYAGTELGNNESASITKNGNETEYDPTVAVDSKTVAYGPYATLSEGYYRVDIEVALTGKNAVADIKDQNVFAFDVTSNWGSKKLHIDTACTVFEVSTDGKYAIVSRYFKITDETASAIELHVATWNGGNVGFKLRGYAFYKIDKFVFGDVDGEGNTNAADVTQLKQLIVNTRNSVSCEADLNDDGIVNIKDLVVMKKYLTNGYWESPVATVFYSNFKTADTVYYIENNNLSRAERDMIMSLQGIVAKEESRIYIKQNSETEEFEQLKNEYGIKMIEATDPWHLVDVFRNKISDNGFVRYTTYYYEHDYTDNPNAPDSINVAATIAGQENYLMVDDSLVDEAIAHGLSQKMSALDYTPETVFAKYKDTLNKKIFVSVSNLNHALYDVSIALGCMAYRGELMDDFISQMEPDGLVLGWYDNELSAVRTVSEYGYSTLAMDGFVNGTVTAGLKRVAITQKSTNYVNSNKSDVHYVTFIMSDGDNINYDKAMATGRYFDIENIGSIPFGWSLNPGSYEWIPNTANKLYNEMTSNDYFVASVSGYGYMFPNLYPKDYLDDYVKRTAEYMKQSDMNYITIASNNIDSSELDNYMPYFAENDQILGGHFNDMSSKSEAYVHRNYGGGVVWYNDKPFIYDRESFATGWNITADRKLTTEDAISQMADRINNLYARNINSIEGYTIINVHPWSVDYEDCMALVEQFNDDVVVVTPKEFFELVTENVPHTNYLDMADKNMTYGLQNVYIPADTTNYNADHLTVQDDNGTNVLVYDPTVIVDNSTTNTATVFGPYKNLDAGCYRVDFEIALTGNDKANFITDNSVLFDIEINGETSYVRKADLNSDINNEGYAIYTKYFKLNEDAREMEYRIYVNGGMCGFKIRKIYTYDASQSEYDSFCENDTLVMRFNAADKLSAGSSFTVYKDDENGTMTFNGSSYGKGGNVLFGPYISLEKGHYIVEVDAAVNGKDSNNSITLFELRAASAGEAITDKLKFTQSSLGSDGAHDFKIVSLDFNLSSDLSKSFELQFSVPAYKSTAGFLIREIRIYKVD